MPQTDDESQDSRGDRDRQIDEGGVHPSVAQRRRSPSRAQDTDPAAAAAAAAAEADALVVGSLRIDFVVVVGTADVGQDRAVRAVTRRYHLLL